MTAKEVVVRNAGIKIFAVDAAPVHFELDMVYVTGIIGHLQLAFRHPANTGPTRQLIEKFVRDLIECIDPGHGEVYWYLMMGFDPTHDE